MAAEMFANNKRGTTAWQGLYLRLILQTLLLVGFIPLTAIAIFLLRSNWYFFAAPYVLTWLFVGYQLNEWKCPSCLRSFLKRGQYGLTLPRKNLCVNCGLAMGEATDPNRSARAPALAHTR